MSTTAVTDLRNLQDVLSRINGSTELQIREGLDLFLNKLSPEFSEAYLRISPNATELLNVLAKHPPKLSYLIIDVLGSLFLVSESISSGLFKSVWTSSTRKMITGLLGSADTKYKLAGMSMIRGAFHSNPSAVSRTLKFDDESFAKMPLKSSSDLRSNYFAFMNEFLSLRNPEITKIGLAQFSLIPRMLTLLAYCPTTELAGILDQVIDNVILLKRISNKSKLMLFSPKVLESLLATENTQLVFGFLTRVIEFAAVRPEDCSRLVLKILKSLNSLENAKHREFALQLLSQFIDLVPSYIESLGLAFDPRPTQRWFSNMGFLSQVWRLRSQRVRHVFPSTWSRVTITAALNHSNALVKFTALNSLISCFHYIAAIDSDNSKLQMELYNSLPTVQTLVACRSSLEAKWLKSQDKTTLITLCDVVKLIQLYNDMLPVVMVDSGFDVSKLISAVSFSKMHPLIQVSLLQLTLKVGEASWGGGSGVISCFQISQEVSPTNLNQSLQNILSMKHLSATDLTKLLKFAYFGSSDIVPLSNEECMLLEVHVWSQEFINHRERLSGLTDVFGYLLLRSIHEPSSSLSVHLLTATAMEFAKTLDSTDPLLTFFDAVWSSLRSWSPALPYMETSLSSIVAGKRSIVGLDKPQAKRRKGKKPTSMTKTIPIGMLRGVRFRLLIEQGNDFLGISDVFKSIDWSGIPQSRRQEVFSNIIRLCESDYTAALHMQSCTGLLNEPIALLHITDPIRVLLLGLVKHMDSIRVLQLIERMLKLDNQPTTQTICEELLTGSCEIDYNTESTALAQAIFNLLVDTSPPNWRLMNHLIPLLSNKAQVMEQYFPFNTLLDGRVDPDLVNLVGSVMQLEGTEYISTVSLAVFSTEEYSQKWITLCDKVIQLLASGTHCSDEYIHNMDDQLVANIVKNLRISSSPCNIVSLLLKRGVTKFSSYKNDLDLDALVLVSGTSKSLNKRAWKLLNSEASLTSLHISEEFLLKCTDWISFVDQTFVSTVLLTAGSLLESNNIAGIESINAVMSHLVYPSKVRVDSSATLSIVESYFTARLDSDEALGCDNDISVLKLWKNLLTIDSSKPFSPLMATLYKFTCSTFDLLLFDIIDLAYAGRWEYSVLPSEVDALFEDFEDKILTRGPRSTREELRVWDLRYDERSLLPLVLTFGNEIGLKTLFAKGFVSYAIMCLSNEDSLARTWAYEVLGAIYNRVNENFMRHITHRGAYEFKEIPQIWHVMETMRASIAKHITSDGVDRHPGLICSFFAQALLLQQCPWKPAYSRLNNFLLRRKVPVIDDIHDIPMFFQLFVGSKKEAVKFQENSACRLWILDVISRGLESSLDHFILSKRFVFPLLMNYISHILSSDFSLADFKEALNGEFKAVINVFTRAAMVPRCLGELIQDQGFFSWLDSLLPYVASMDSNASFRLLELASLYITRFYEHLAESARPTVFVQLETLTLSLIRVFPDPWTVSSNSDRVTSAWSSVLSHSSNIPSEFLIELVRNSDTFLECVGGTSMLPEDEKLLSLWVEKAHNCSSTSWVRVLNWACQHPHVISKHSTLEHSLSRTEFDWNSRQQLKGMLLVE